MADKIINVDKEREKIQAFNAETREEMQAVLNGIEKDFTQLLDKLLRVEVVDFEKQIAKLLSSQGKGLLAAGLDSGALQDGVGGIIQNVFGDSSDSLVGQSLSRALQIAAGGVLNKDSINPRAVFNAGGSVVGQYLGEALGGSDDGSFRLSRAQAANEASFYLQRGQRDG